MRTRIGQRSIRAALLTAVTCVLIGAFGAAQASAVVFSNPAAIAVPASGDKGPATPYPSQIVVAGLGSSITDVNVKFSGLGHTAPTDVDALLVGPLGQTVLLMSDAPQGSACADDVLGADLTFDDAAAGPIPNATLASGTYKPTDYDSILVGSPCTLGGEVFPAPAPSEPPSYGTTLSVFNGTNPNGTWSLYVVDDDINDVGSIAGGWSLDIAAPPTCAAPGPGAITGTAGMDRLYGTPGPDVILGGGGGDQIYAGDGDDLICGEAGMDQIHGEAGADKVYGGASGDQLYGEAGTDQLYGEDGGDQLYGGDDADALEGGAGSDICNGGAATDTAVTCESLVAIG